MVVQHNLTAMNSNRMLGITTDAQAKSTEKLSSGYKINRAADDAAGLSISEKMRKQIRGLTQASANAEDGISAVQTAEGALTEVHDMLQRMNELAVKSANGTNSVSDRESIQAEINQLVTEIDRVAETTKFNEAYLLKGDKNAVKGYSYGYNTIGAASASTAAATMNVDQATKLTVQISFASGVSDDDQNELAVALKNQGINVSVELTTDITNSSVTNSQEAKYTVSLNGAVADKFTVVATGAGGQRFDIKNAKGEVIATMTASGIVANGTGDSAKADGVYSANITASKITAAYTAGENFKLYDADGNGIAANALDKYYSASIPTGQTQAAVAARPDAVAVYDAVGNKVALASMAAMVSATQDVTGSLQLKLHVGADATANNQITLNLDSMSAKGLGIAGLRVDGADDSNALEAVEKIAAALAKVSAQRSDLGAVQNRLEHTIANLDNVVENTTAAESQIRDTDMATEMVNYSKNQILQQAGQSMLAQANQANQGVLSLLQ